MFDLSSSPNFAFFVPVAMALVCILAGLLGLLALAQVLLRRIYTASLDTSKLRLAETPDDHQRDSRFLKN